MKGFKRDIVVREVQEHPAKKPQNLMAWAGLGALGTTEEQRLTLRLLLEGRQGGALRGGVGRS